MSDSGELLTGGNSNRVLKAGESVVRQSGAWSPFVHRLLEYLTASGFKESPVLLAHDAHTERLSFLPGEVGNYPLKPYMQTEAVLDEAAALLRRFHDLTQHVVVPPDAAFLLPARAHEVICHNDFAPYNLVFNDGHITGIIDFDTAGPGTRLWDIAYAVYRFAPLATDTHAADCGWQPIPDRAARLKRFCDVYGLDQRDQLIPAVKERLTALVDHMRQNHSNLDHIPIYIADLAYISQHEQALTEAITR